MTKRLALPKTITIPAGVVLETAPNKVKFHEQHYQYIIGIGDNHVGYLYMDEEAVLAMRDMEPEATIS